MNARQMSIFYSELEKLATYNNESISEDEFVNKLFEIKRDFELRKKDIPEILKNVRSKSDFRNDMQKIGGYKERREKLRENLYPIIEMYENEIFEKKEYKSEGSVKEINTYLKNNNYQFKTKYGIIKIFNLETKSGGNGTVYFGKISGMDVAIKFLINNTKEKINRFLCEYGNIILKLEEKDGIVKMYFYDELVINNNIYPMICMKKYDNKLMYREDYTEDEIINIVKQILYATKKIHDVGIVHRDLKPDNLLIANNKVYIADFGIAYFNPDYFEETGHTKEGERLANYDFSAPEQRNSKTNPVPNMDIYAIGQIIQWLVYGKTTKGTHRKKLYEKIDTPRMHFLDQIVDKCLNDDPIGRYQNINEILFEIEEYNADKKGKKSNEIKIEIEQKNKINNLKELKEALRDVMDKLCIYNFGEYDAIQEKTFSLMAPMDDMEVIQFLESIPYNLEKLEFFEKVGMSKFLMEHLAYDSYQLDKDYFQILYQLYEKIKLQESKNQNAFVEYVKTRLNENFELPF